MRTNNTPAAYLNRVVNNNISQKGKVKNFHLNDPAQTYRVIIMLARHWHTDVKSAYYMYSEYLCTGKTPAHN